MHTPNFGGWTDTTPEGMEIDYLLSSLGLANKF